MKVLHLSWIVCRTLWTFPTTAVGLLIALPCVAYGSRLQIRQGTLEAHSGPLAFLLEHATVLRGGALAITFGDLILGRSAAALDVVRRHEQVHVRQAHALGPFFIPAYLGASVLALLHGHNGYRGNVFEKQAYEQTTEDPTRR